MMPVGPILLSVMVILVYFGFGDRLLHTLGFTPRTAILLAAASLLGSLAEVPLATGLSVNLGGGILPLIVAIYILAASPGGQARARGAWAVAAAALTTYTMGRWFPPGQPTELNLFYLDAQYLFALTAGLTGFVAGGSPRPALSGAMLGVVLADLGHYARFALGTGTAVPHISLGGGGFQLTAIAAGLLAVSLAAALGEAAVLDASEEVNHN